MKLWICLSVLLLGCSAGASPEEPRKAVIVAPVAVRQDVPRPAAFASFPTSPVNASSIKGLPVPTPTPTGAVLTVAAGPSLIWNVPAAGVMLASTTPAPVSASAGAVGVGSTAARSDHVHLLPTVPTTKGGFGQDVSTGLTDGYIAKVVSGAIVIAAIAAGDLPTGIDVAKLAAGTVTNTVFGYLANVTSDIQTQLNGKQSTLTLPLSIANGGTNSGTALSNNRAIVSSSGNIVETASACGVGTVLNGGSPPNCTATPTIGTSLTVPRIDSSGSLILNGATGGNVQLSVNSTTVLTAAATGLTATQPLAMSSKNITGLAPATANGDALSYPWITSGATFNTLASGFNITASNGTYAGTGLTYTFPEAGTYWCEATVRSSVGVSVGAGANISLKLRNTTTSTDITNSIRIGAYASTIGVAYITTTPFAEVVTVSGADTLEVYAASNTGTTYTTRSVDSDSAGYSKLGCMKIAP